MGAIGNSPAVALQLESTPEASGLVRGALSAAGERLALSSELLDDLRTAVTEACNNVAMHAYGGLTGPLAARMYVEPDSVAIVVRDHGIGIDDDALDREQERGIGVMMIRALARQALVVRVPDGGTEVRMRFDARPSGPLPAVPEDGWMTRLSGDAVGSISPLSLLEGVLGRVTRALSARARFSLDRFSDISLATDVISRHAAGAASADRIAFGLAIGTRRLELTIGPIREGSSGPLARRKPLSLLIDHLDIVGAGGGKLIRVVIEEPRPSS